jgi:hypothetical protein
MLRRLAPWLIIGVLALAATGCGGSDPTPVSSESIPHTHTSLPAGDGTQASYVGYAMKDVTFPTKAGTPGTYGFRIDYAGKPLTKYVVDLTKKMHVYLVSKDLSIYRHIHPTMAADGRWSGNVTVPEDGQYRLITEFMTSYGGNTVQLVLGVEENVGAPAQPVPLPLPSTTSTTDGVTVSVVTKPSVGYEHQMELGLTTAGKAASLGTYLDVYAHVSAFDVKTGGLVHMHPLTAPVTKGDKSVLDFHTGFEEPGEYRMFVQTRISGIVRTIPITVDVTG